MKTALLTIMALWAISPAWSQAEPHYDLVSANEVVRGPEYTVTLASWERQKLEITVEKPLDIPVEINLRTLDRELIRSDRTADPKRQLVRLFNLTQLPAGEYWLDIWVGKTLIRRAIRIDSIEQPFRRMTVKQ